MSQGYKTRKKTIKRLQIVHGKRGWRDGYEFVREWVLRCAA